jgi:hypothetical protein
LISLSIRDRDRSPALLAPMFRLIKALQVFERAIENRDNPLTLCDRPAILDDRWRPPPFAQKKARIP